MKPNILLIMSDQHSRRFTGAYGHHLVHTPQIDALAERGVLFENSYCNSPLCVPSRMSFMSGKLPHRIRVWDNHRVLSPDHPTWAQILASGGYEVILSGRMHFQKDPKLYGFTAHLSEDGTKNASIPNWRRYRGGGIAQKYHFHGLPCGVGRTSQCEIDDQTEGEAADFIKSRKDSDRPWALTVGFLAPHRPWVVEQKYWDLYDLDAIDLPHIPPGHLKDLHQMHKRNRRIRDIPADGFPEEDVRRARASYYASISRIDEKVGRLCAALRQTGQLEDTLIIYTSDHGDMLGEHGLWQKSSLYEESVGVPMIFSWKDNLPEGLRVKAGVSLVDLAVTLAGFGGTGEPQDGMDGRDLMGAAGGQDLGGEDEVRAEYYATWTDRPLAMLCSGRYKLIYSPGEKPQFFDLEEDPREMFDLADSEKLRDIREKMTCRLLASWDPQVLEEAVLESQKERLDENPDLEV